MSIEGEGSDAAGAEADDDGPDKAEPAEGGALHLDAVLFVDALGNLLKEASGVAGALAASLRLGIAVGG